MTLSDLVQQARAQGLTLTVRGDRLVCRGPKAALASELLGVLRDRKPELLTFLVEEEREREQLTGYGLARCPECRRIMCAYHIEGERCDDCGKLPAAPPVQESLTLEEAPA